MKTSLRVDSGITSGAVHPLDRRVVRVGSGKHVDVRIPSSSFAAHALTLEFRSNDWTIHNRSGESVEVAGKSVATNNAVLWAIGQSVRSADGTILTLIVADLSKPEDFADSHEVDDMSAEISDSGQADSTKKPNRSVQIAVIVLCVLGMLGMWTFSGSNRATPTPSVTIAQIAERWAGDRQILYRLQEADIALGAKRTDKARTIYLEIRNWLLSQSGGLDAVESDGERMLLSLIRQRLMETF